jgi:hypothetical protein
MILELLIARPLCPVRALCVVHSEAMGRTVRLDALFLFHSAVCALIN